MAAAQHPGSGDPEELLPLALSRPHDALRRARAVLAENPPPLSASMAHQAIGIVLRETGDIDQAVEQLRLARRLAHRSGSPAREADVLATLGVALAFAGRTGPGRAALNAAAGRSTGVLNGRILLRRGGVLRTLGHYREALADLNTAIGTLCLADDQLWEARARTERAFTYLALGSLRRAADDLGLAEVLFTGTGQQLESADAVVHRGVLALRSGDLPAALACFDEAAERFEELGVPDADLSIHRCTALLTAGLPADARDEAEAALTRLEQIRGRPTKRAELLLTSAGCSLAAGRPGQALDRAAQAGQLFLRQGRHWWRAHARLAMVQARHATGPATPSLLRDARRCCRELDALASPQLAAAQLLTGRIALALGRPAQAGDSLADAARGRARGPALSRATAWLAEALHAEAAGDTRRLMHACRRGLEVIDEYRWALGSSELRAQATAHGAELAALGQRQALRSGRPRTLLTWSERWRASALAVPPVRPSGDEARAELAALRDVTSRVADALSQGRPSAALLQREQVRLERQVRARALRTRGPQPTTPPGRRAQADAADLLQALGPQDRLLELVEVDGQMHVLVCGDGRVTRYRAGSIQQATEEVEYARFGLTRLAFGMSRIGPERVLADLRDAATGLEALLLGGARNHLGHGRLVIVPPGRLHAVPWGLLPTLRDRVISVAPSATIWLRAHRATQGAGQVTAAPGGTAGGTAGHRVTLVHGPGLVSQGLEITAVAAEYAERVEGTGPRLLGNGSATALAVLRALDGADLAHIAAHGTFRADSPLFSALHLDDGPLTVYDLQRLQQAPRRLVLSSCDSGLAAPAGADELLGLASALIPLGTAGIAASVVPVNDAAAVDVMTVLHRALRRRADLAEALREARRCGTDPVAQATAASFVCLGAG
jgi:tetratricopeptide (TPR) repeat protein